MGERHDPSRGRLPETSWFHAAMGQYVHGPCNKRSLPIPAHGPAALVDLSTQHLQEEPPQQRDGPPSKSIGSVNQPAYVEDAKAKVTTLEQDSATFILEKEIHLLCGSHRLISKTELMETVYTMAPRLKRNMAEYNAVVSSLEDRGYFVRQGGMLSYNPNPSK
eukprot:gb/GEZN01008013.1/.p1 GENE.gb/GEZN01008013.1/~~gb/GEZN01008013.1/.p1  ORF type:complete len:163 (-),score=22.80 gb/GEZN01008013.1/:909-1397(-)